MPHPCGIRSVLLLRLTGTRLTAVTLTQCLDTTLQRRVGGEQCRELTLTANTEGHQLTVQLTGLIVGLLQGRQRTDHSGRADQLGTGLIGTELTATAEPGDDGGRKNAQHNFRRSGRYVEGSTGAVAFVCQSGALNKVTGDTGEEHHEGVYRALNLRQGKHIAVGTVADFMAQHSLD